MRSTAQQLQIAQTDCCLHRPPAHQRSLPANCRHSSRQQCCQQTAAVHSRLFRGGSCDAATSDTLARRDQGCTFGCCSLLMYNMSIALHPRGTDADRRLTELTAVAGVRPDYGVEQRTRWCRSRSCRSSRWKMRRNLMCVTRMALTTSTTRCCR